MTTKNYIVDKHHFYDKMFERASFLKDSEYYDDTFKEWIDSMSIYFFDKICKYEMP